MDANAEDERHDVVVGWLRRWLNPDESDKEPDFEDLTDAADRSLCEEWITRVREAVEAADDELRSDLRWRSEVRSEFCMEHRPGPPRDEAQASGSIAPAQVSSDAFSACGMGGGGSRERPASSAAQPLPAMGTTSRDASAAAPSLRLRAKCSQAVHEALQAYGQGTGQRRSYNKDLKGLEALSMAVAVHLFVSEKVLDFDGGAAPLFQPRPSATLGGVNREGSKLVDLVQAHWSAFHDDFSYWSVEPLGAGCRLWVEALSDRRATRFPLHQHCRHGALRRLIKSDVDVEIDDTLSDGPLEVHRVVLFVDYWLRELSRLEGHEEERAVHPYFHPTEFPRCFSRVAAEYSNRDLLAGVESEMKPLQDTELSSKSLRGFLFFGPPGTGKTTIIVKLCKYLGFSLAHKGPVSPGELLGALQGEQENKVKSLLLRAKAVPWLPMAIVLDEIEGLVPDRSRKEAESRLGAISIMLNMWPGDMPNNFIFAATNIKSMIDAAVLRRFGRKHFVGLTTPEDRRRWQGWPQGADLSEVQEDLVQMTINFSGANMNDLVDQVALDLSNRLGSGASGGGRAEQAQVHKYKRDEIARCVRDVCKQQSVLLGKDYVPDLIKRCREFPFELSVFADWLLEGRRLQWTTGRIFADLTKGCIEVEYNESAHNSKAGEGRREVCDDVSDGSTDDDDEKAEKKLRSERQTPHTEDEDLKHAELWTRAEVLEHLSLSAGYGKGKRTVRTYKRMDQGMISIDTLLQLLLKVASSRNMQGLKLVDWMSLRTQAKLKQEDCLELLHHQIEELRQYKRAMLVLVLDAAGVAMDKGSWKEDDNPGTVVQGDLFTDMVQASHFANIQAALDGQAGEYVVEEEFLVVVVADSEATASRFRAEGKWPRGWDEEVNDRLAEAENETVACELCGKDFQESQEAADNPCKWHTGELYAYLKTWQEKGRNLMKEYPDGDPMSLEFLESSEEQVKPKFIGSWIEGPPRWCDVARPEAMKQRMAPRTEIVWEGGAPKIRWRVEEPRYHEKQMSYDEMRENMRWTCCAQNSRCQECPHALPQKHRREGGPSRKEAQDVEKPTCRYCFRCGATDRESKRKCKDHPFISPFEASEQWCNFCCTNVKQHVPGSKGRIPGCRETSHILCAGGREALSAEPSDKWVGRVHKLSKKILLHPERCGLYMRRLEALQNVALATTKSGTEIDRRYLNLHLRGALYGSGLEGVKHGILQDLLQLIGKRFRKSVLAQPAPTREHGQLCELVKLRKEFEGEMPLDEWTRFGQELLQLLEDRPARLQSGSLRLRFFSALRHPDRCSAEALVEQIEAEFLEDGQLKEQPQPDYPDRYKFLIFAAAQRLRQPMQQWSWTAENQQRVKDARSLAEAAKKAAETDSSSKGARAEAQFCLAAALYSCWAYRVDVCQRQQQHQQPLAGLGDAASLLSRASELAAGGRSIYRDSIEDAQKWLCFLKNSRSVADLKCDATSLDQLPLEQKIILASAIATAIVNDESARGDGLLQLGKEAARLAREKLGPQNDLPLQVAVAEVERALSLSTQPTRALNDPTQSSPRCRLMAPHPGRIFMPLSAEKLVWRWDWDSVSAVPWELPLPDHEAWSSLLTAIR